LPPQPAPSQQRKEEFARRYEPTESALKKAVGSSESSKGKWGVLIALLAAGAAVAYYFGVYEPQQYQQVTSIPAAAAPVQVEAHEPAPTTAPLDAAVVVDAGADTDAGEGDAGPLEAPAAAPVDAGPSPGMPIDAGAAIAVAAPVEVIDAGHRVAEPKRSFDNLLAQADSLRERERFEAAMNLYGQAHEMRPDRVEPLAGRGLSLLDLGHAAAAEAAFEQALKLNSRYGPAIMGLAEALRTQGNKARAIEFYQRYLDVLPNGVEASVARNNIERLKK
jgi:tetratricopeptide (TPR) repeat protein